jgi:predicted DNA-binding protein (MmcQ/YjbR family)
MPPAALGTAFSAVDSPERMSPTAAGRYDQPVTKDELLAHCLSKPDTVVKVGPKIFAFLGSGDGAATHGSVGVKCAANRDAADEWLKLYPDDASVMPYIGRSGWNTLRFGGAIPDDEVLDAVDESYRMILAKLPKKDRPA